MEHDTPEDRENYVAWINDHHYYAVPESWIEVGVDDRRGQGPQLLAVSVAIVRPSTLKIRYAHPLRSGVGTLYVPTRDDSETILPDGDLEPWSRSIAASQLTPVDRIRQPEREILVDLWGDRVSDVLEDCPDVDQPLRMASDGGQTDDWSPSTAELRDDETTDRSSHARRNLEQIKLAREELSDDQLQEIGIQEEGA